MESRGFQHNHQIIQHFLSCLRDRIVYSINTAVEMTPSVFSPQRLLNGFTIEDVFVQANYFLRVAVGKVKEEFVDARIAEFRNVVEEPDG